MRLRASRRWVMGSLAAVALVTVFGRAHPSAKVLIEGHCDERGTTEYNLALGARFLIKE